MNGFPPKAHDAQIVAVLRQVMNALDGAAASPEILMGVGVNMLLNGVVRSNPTKDGASATLAHIVPQVAKSALSQYDEQGRRKGVQLITPHGFH